MTYTKVGLIGAMVEEIELFHEHMKEVTEHEKAGITYWEGTFQGKPVVLCRSGVGKVNAAVCTQILIDRFGVEAVVFTGVAGALDPSLEIGDIVISTECLQHDMDVRALGFERGVIPFAEASVFPADPGLSDKAYEVSESLFEGRTKRGRVLSGDQFIASRETVAELHRELNGACTEMEGASVAQVCHMNGVPFVILRSMSDKADGSAHINFPEFTKQASLHSYRIVEGLVGKI
ncbi:5'-methylthioadenosine/adenosylhomocysteine nucleosidase [Paenibacillus aurantius]|uniref:adenosylhomocysteine nucleosidase n=1 Tax=Paenibacillus aurantius TaxID=2918900 RepID=A0AA96RHK2_9BACL|nr:5'-methylthioadenosine/adenosylhomocysteine nucleosidase [Paenibacillus aurantius]WJH33182.1 5'-methylthioadenosine/adenosylhomocysteine nucleosidase [Paenibacillus sp. CC-CFT747]WNQ13631.1 5'-methylthioadenosine/adenosylhomocysteine nucleosidase [Paenibacillus aurantius]